MYDLDVAMNISYSLDRNNKSLLKEWCWLGLTFMLNGSR